MAQAGYRASLRQRSAAAPKPLPAVDREFDFDLAVIGTGGGMAAAIKAAELGRWAVIIEAGVLGSACVNIGCVPSKALIRAAEAYHRAGHRPFAGVHTQAGGLDWPALIGQKDALVGELRLFSALCYELGNVQSRA